MKRIILFLSLFLLLAAAGCSNESLTAQESLLPSDTEATADAPPDGTEVSITPGDVPREANPSRPDGELQVFVFDVGQADCILVKTENHSLLIDAGNIGQDDLILEYLAEQGVDRLDLIVATHPHADHIGAMAGVIKGVENVGAILMPDVIHTTRTFERLLDAIEEKDIPVDIAKPGDKIAFGNAGIQILAPNSDSYTELNDYSVVLRVEYGRTSFLFAGDAEEKSENEQLLNGLPLQADVLKAGHHGSRTGSSQRYLEAVAPKYAVISLCKDNSYGHPHGETMERLAGTGAEIYRTDENGTVSFISNGETVIVNTERGSDWHQ